MELIELKHRIQNAYTGTPDDLEKILRIVSEDKSIFPFNEYEHLICNLLENGGLIFQKYLEIRQEYIRNNPNLWLFEISAPRAFGEGFAQTYVQGKCTKLQKPSRSLDPQYSGDYDLWLDGIRIEVKASRAVDKDSDEPLYMKALSRTTKRRFWMNFQQLKPQFCDVFVWVAVFRDEILIWVLNSKEVAESTLYSEGQHRGNAGNEGQLHITDENISQMARYLLKGDKLETAIKNAHKRLMASGKRK